MTRMASDGHERASRALKPSANLTSLSLLAACANTFASSTHSVKPFCIK
jgi:hypothetical protein